MGATLADVLIAAGVGGEVLFSMMGARRQSELRLRSNAKLEAATIAAGAANERAAKLEKEAEKARERTAEIERITAWRRIHPEQQTLLRFELGKFTGGSVIIRWFMYDIESQNLAEDIGAIFKLSGWKHWLSPEAYSGNFAYGLRVSAPYARTPAEYEKNEWAAKIVQKAFNNSSLDFASLRSPESHMQAGGHGDPTFSPCAEVYVGPKPPPRDE